MTRTEMIAHLVAAGEVAREPMLKAYPYSGRCSRKSTGNGVRRRDVVALLGALAMWPAATFAQERPLPRIGLLLPAQPHGPAGNGIIRSLAELGYVHGKTAEIGVRYAEGRLERLPELARELVALPVDVMVSVAASATVAARRATGTIPIVMVHAGDPIGYGLIETLARPGGNVTGTASYSPELVPKGIELLRELVPTKRLAMLVVPSNAGTPLAIRQAQATAGSLGMHLTVVGVERAEDLDTAFATIERVEADSLYVSVEGMLYNNRSKLLDFAARKRLPTMYQHGDLVRDGGLIGYSPLFSAHYPLAAAYVEKILKGANPSELPVEQSARYELAINLKTAKILGVTVPPTILARADEIVE